MDFKILETPHLQLYHYQDSNSTLMRYAQWAEKWYQLHSNVLQDSIKVKNPLMLYQNHADFQQSVVIGELIGVGTGGVTEGFKNRIILPWMHTCNQTQHVLGHELVHAFQYNMLKTHDSLSIYNIRNLPLWLVEGMAEYMSIGKEDPLTAMWMRDAVIHNDIPDLKKLSTNQTYFPYRFGQAFWAYVTAQLGDTVIKPFFVKTAKNGLDSTLRFYFNASVDSVSKTWQMYLHKLYAEPNQQKPDSLIGNLLTNEAKLGSMNVSPALSPDGTYLAFYSAKDIFSIDLYLAEAVSGKIIQKLTTERSIKNADAVEFIESSVAWSADSKHVAYVVIEKGKSTLIILNAKRRKVIRKIKMPGVPYFNYPAFSPDGESIVVAGLVNGQNDLFRYYLKTNQVEKLTNDVYSEIQPCFNYAGTHLVFTSDRLSQQANTGKLKLNHHLSILNLKNKEIEDIPQVGNVDAFNPVFTANDSEVVYLSTHGGYRNIWIYQIKTQKHQALTRYYTGVSGITFLSQALSIDKKNNIAYSYFSKRAYAIYRTTLKTLQEKVTEKNLNNGLAGHLAIPNERNQLITNSLEDNTPLPTISALQTQVKKYKSKFKLDYIGNTGVGIATSPFGAGVVGGVNSIFSDMLNNHLLYSALAINGQLRDIAGTLAYLNQSRKLNYGVSISHIPYRSTGVGLDKQAYIKNNDTLLVDNYYQDLLRTFEDQFNVFVLYPFSQTKRFELGAAQINYNYQIIRENNLYFQGNAIESYRETRPRPEALTITQLNAAFVHDNSFFGIASPLKGKRYRISLQEYLNELTYHSALIDYRHYYYLKPVSFAARGMYVGRLGKDAEHSRITPLFIGYPFFIRGFEPSSVARLLGNQAQEQINQMSGSQVAVINFEVRLPFSGFERLALIKSNTFFTEIACFIDAGMAWNQYETPEMNFRRSVLKRGERKPIVATGMSVRINLFGAIILEPYYAFPLFREKVKSGTFGLNFTPGW